MSAGIQDIGGQQSLLRIEDIQGSYTIPHIQSSRDLDFEVTFSHPSAVAARVELLQNGLIREASRQAPTVRFSALTPGEYDIRVSFHDQDGGIISQELHNGFAIGTVIGAIGDSITEGSTAKDIGGIISTSLQRIFQATRSPRMVGISRNSPPPPIAIVRRSTATPVGCRASTIC